jgi:tRNA acetyltransferase TAN1
MSDSRNTKSAEQKKRKKFPKGGFQSFFRGGPAILLTCETGREHKCKMQGLDILKHYSMKNGEEEEDTSLCLEDELKKLKSSSKEAKNSDSFSTHNSGCKGSVFLLCTMESCRLIPTIQTEFKKAKAANESEGTEDSAIPKNGNENENNDKEQKEPEKKKLRLEGEKNEETMKADEETKQDEAPQESKNDETSNEPPWDPIDTVRRIMSDNETKASGAPSSRFVTRMIPLQATCYASIEELNLTTQALVEKYLPRDAKTFAVESKRRSCDNLTRDQIIETVASKVLAVLPDCKVKLEKPDVTILVEICRTLCGVSVIENCASFKRFNLAVAREGEM